MNNKIQDFANVNSITFQQPGNLNALEIITVHDCISYFLIIIISLVIWLLIVIIESRMFIRQSLKYWVHGVTLEIVWTLIPIIILVIISIPSFNLLYLLEDSINCKITFKAIASQWYWTYDYNDYCKDINFSSYLIPTEELFLGQNRLLEVDNYVVLPIGVLLRAIITSSDVLHAWAIPSLGIKIDACPGRLNQIIFIILKKGIYMGQCSELCGVEHQGMPIIIEAVSICKYLSWINSF